MLHWNPIISEIKLQNYTDFSLSCRKVKQDDLLFSSEVLRDPLRGRQPGVSRSEEVCVFFSFMGNTIKLCPSMSHTPSCPCPVDVLLQLQLTVS